MTTRELEKLKSKLPARHRIILWKRLGKYSLSAISAVLRGDYNNNEILSAAVELAEEYQCEINKCVKKINEL